LDLLFYIFYQTNIIPYTDGRTPLNSNFWYISSDSAIKNI